MGYNTSNKRRRLAVSGNLLPYVTEDLPSAQELCKACRSVDWQQLLPCLDLRYADCAEEIRQELGITIPANGRCVVLKEPGGGYWIMDRTWEPASEVIFWIGSEDTIRSRAPSCMLCALLIETLTAGDKLLGNHVYKPLFRTLDSSPGAPYSRTPTSGIGFDMFGDALDMKVKRPKTACWDIMRASIFYDWGKTTGGEAIRDAFQVLEHPSASPVPQSQLPSLLRRHPGPRRDKNLFKLWLNTCGEQHSKCALLSESRPDENIRLINVESL